jgi:hypothetical protein
VVRQLVRAGGQTLRAAGPTAPAGGEGLLDHAALTVTGAGRTVVLPLRVLSAAWKMGFLGPESGAPEAPAGGDVLGGIAAGPAGGGPGAPPAGGDVLGGIAAGPEGGGPAAPPAGSEVPGGIAAGPEDGRNTRPAARPVPAGPEQVVVVSAAGGWARLAAPYGSAYHRVTPELGVLPG